MHAPNPPQQSADLHRPGGPFDVQPVRYWQPDAPDGGRGWPMSHPGELYKQVTPKPTDDVMPGAIPPHSPSDTF